MPTAPFGDWCASINERVRSSSRCLHRVRRVEQGDQTAVRDAAAEVGTAELGVRPHPLVSILWTSVQ